MAKEKSYRSIVKAFSWRATGTFDTIVVSFFVTGELSHAFAIGGVEVVTKFFLYFFHERIWNRINWGRVVEDKGIEYQI